MHTDGHLRHTGRTVPRPLAWGSGVELTESSPSFLTQRKEGKEIREEGNGRERGSGRRCAYTFNQETFVMAELLISVAVLIALVARVALSDRRGKIKEPEGKLMPVGPSKDGQLTATPRVRMSEWKSADAAADYLAPRYFEKDGKRYVEMWVNEIEITQHNTFSTYITRPHLEVFSVGPNGEIMRDEDVLATDQKQGV